MALPWHVRITDETVCLAAIDPPRIFDYYPDAIAAWADLPRANANSLAPATGYEVLSYYEYRAGLRAFYLDEPLCEITPEEYDYALNVLPPMQWERGDGVRRFLMSEFQHASYTRQYAVWQGRYFTRIVDAEDRTTWITATDCAALAPAPVPTWNGRLG